MSDFFTDLWSSVFTPGATPTLLVATNASFAALLLLLLSLLALTRSVHFVILSALCAGLWWSINWFASEVSALKEEEQQRLKADKGSKGVATASSSGSQLTAADGGAAADSEDTETEELAKQAKGLRQRQAAAAPALSASSVSARVVAGTDDADLSASTGGLSVHSVDSRARNSTGNVSGTDSEWDKLDSENE